MFVGSIGEHSRKTSPSESRRDFLGGNLDTRGLIYLVTRGVNGSAVATGDIGVAAAVIFGIWIFVMTYEHSPVEIPTIPDDLESDRARPFRTFLVIRDQIRGSLTSRDRQLDPLSDGLGEIAQDRVRRYRGSAARYEPGEFHEFSSDLATRS